MHVGGVAVFEEPADGFRPRPAGRADLASASRSCRATASASGGCPGRLANPVWVDDENFDVNYHVRRSALPRPGNDEQLPSWSPGCRAAGWTAPGRCGRCTSSRASPTAASRSSPRPTTRWSTASAPSTSARSSSTPAPEPRRRPAGQPGDRRPEPSWVELVAGAVAETVRRPDGGGRHGRAAASPRYGTPAGRLLGAAGGLLAAAHARPRGPHRTARSTPRSASSAASPWSRTRPRRLPPHPQGPRRRHGQRRRAGHRRRGAAGLAADARRAGQPGDHGAGDGAGQRAARDDDGRAGAPATGSRRTWSTCRSASRAP